MSGEGERRSHLDAWGRASHAEEMAQSTHVDACQVGSRNSKENSCLEPRDQGKAAKNEVRWRNHRGPVPGLCTPPCSRRHPLHSHLRATGEIQLKPA